MMVYKRITTHKTHTGYSVTVLVGDGALIKPLVAGIERFFETVDHNKNKQEVLDEGL